MFLRSRSTHLRPAGFCQSYDEVEVVILSIDRDKKDVLGIKQLTSDPWTDITNKYPIESKHKVKLEIYKLWSFC